MTTTTPASGSGAPLWTALVGGVLLTALGVYGLVTQSGGSPRYALALVALGVAGVARALGPTVESPAMDQAPRYLTGAAFGLLIAGFM